MWPGGTAGCPCALALPNRPAIGSVRHAGGRALKGEGFAHFILGLSHSVSLSLSSHPPILPLSPSQIYSLLCICAETADIFRILPFAILFFSSYISRISAANIGAKEKI